MFWIIIISILCAAYADPVRICVPESLTSFCSQMERDVLGFKCVYAPDTLKCVQKVWMKEADITNVDHTALFLAGKFYKLRPIATELMHGEPYKSQSIALVRKGSSIQAAKDLKNASACHPGLGRFAGWHIPVSKLLLSDIMPANCQEGDIGSVADFFGASCAPGNWSSDPLVDQQLKTRYSKLCNRCKNPSSCAKNDGYADYEGVYQCLSDGAGDVAFTKFLNLKNYLAKNPAFADVAEILCFEGGCKSVLDPLPCVWGNRPTNAYVTRQDDINAVDEALKVLLNTQATYSAPLVRIPEWYYKSYLSHPNVTGLIQTENDRNNYVSYLGDFIYAMQKPLKGCICAEEGTASLCVSSEAEMSECLDLSAASYVSGAWPDVKCQKAASAEACVESLQEGDAHLLSLCGKNLYKSGRYYNLQPIATVLHNVTTYAVAVTKFSSDINELQQLRGRRSCHTGMGHMNRWIWPVGVLVSHGLLPPVSTCGHVSAMTDFFSSSCAPGANDTWNNPGRLYSDELCRRCIGDERGENRCAQDYRESYSGYAGALRCLTEGGGDVAFVKHTTVTEYTDGRSQLPWTKGLFSSHFQYLCGQGGSDHIQYYQKCNIGQLPAQQVVTRGGISGLRRLQLARVLADVSSLFSNDSRLFRLFRSGNESSELFKFSATGLSITNPQVTYGEVLGKAFLDACIAADTNICTVGLSTEKAIAA